MTASGEWHCEKRPFDKNESFARDNENVPETGCLSIIVLGASGDLAKKKTFPALFNLYRQIKYVSGSYDAPEGFQALDKAISEHEISKNSIEGSSRRLFYLALPPTVYPQVCKMIKNYSMNKSDLGGWTRIVVEKPFGKDLASAEELSSQIGELFEEQQIYRIDHYLGKELVQNLVLCLVAMEKPISLKPEHIRDEKVKVLQSVAPINDGEVVLGQYEGYKDDPTVPDNSNTPTFATMVLHIHNERWEDDRELLAVGVPFILKAGKALSSRKAEIRVQFKDVPGQKQGRNEFVIRLQPSEAIYMKLTVKQPGLEMSTAQSELDLSYRQRYQGVVIPEAYERLILDTKLDNLFLFNNNPVCVFYRIKGDQQHFVRRDELKAAWEIFTPLLHRIDNGEFKSLPYKPGSRGPAEADELLERAGYVGYAKQVQVAEENGGNDVPLIFDKRIENVDFASQPFLNGMTYFSRPMDERWSKNPFNGLVQINQVLKFKARPERFKFQGESNIPQLDIFGEAFYDSRGVVRTLRDNRSAQHVVVPISASTFPPHSFRS
ncbi:hypothetical protein DH2020_037969 [Rehmannia glutinosa]|uniref:glucose-6-phosphate dehydrogenase (NADP(+)) n=1 Tax=Rehmannia glutinosa TaxID=99300 RepID=A0ABR0V077_REHGL